MRISCPHCGFAKTIASKQIPDNVVRVTCPECRQPFPLERKMSIEQPDPSADETITTTQQDDGTTKDAEPVNQISLATDLTNATDRRTEADQNSPLSSRAETDEPAGIGARYAALLIDSMLILIMVLILKSGLTLLGNGIQIEGQIMLGLTFIMFALTLGFTYHTLFIGVCGQTPGKRLLHIQVILSDRSEMTYSRAMLREVLGKTLSAPLLLGYLMALFHPQHLAAHDKIADTCVVKTKPESPRN
jgi:predicted Zn finger-like uncharacterized protein